MKTLRDFGPRSGSGFIHLKDSKRIPVVFSLHLQRWFIEGIPGLWALSKGTLRNWPVAENGEINRLFLKGETFVLEDSEGRCLFSGQVDSQPKSAGCDFIAQADDEVLGVLFGIERTS